MAELKISIAELVGLIKQNLDLSPEITTIYTDGEGITAEIDLPVAGQRSFFITYESFANNILTCKISGKGILDKLVFGLFASILTMIKAFNGNIRAGNLIRTSGDNILIDLNHSLKKIKGLKITRVSLEDGNFIIDMSINKVDVDPETLKEVAASRLPQSPIDPPEMMKTN